MTRPSASAAPAGGAGPTTTRPRRPTLLRRLTARVERGQALKAAAARARRRSPAVDATFETIECDSDLGGAMLAGALSYRLFVFALPLSFFFVAAGGLLADAFGIEADVIPNSVGFAGVMSKQIAAASSSSANWWIALGSLAVLAYETRVLFRSVSIVNALAWERSAASVRLNMRHLGIFAVCILGQVLAAAGVGAIHHRTAVGGVLAVAAYVLVATGLWLAVSLHVPHRTARWRELLPGAALYGVGLTCVAAFNILVLGRLIESKSSTYGALGIAATLLLGFFFVGRIIVGASVLNATLDDRRTRSHREVADG